MADSRPESRWVHIVDDVPELGPDAPAPAARSCSSRSTVSSTPATPAGSPSTTCSAPARAAVVASFDLDAFYDYRARRPPMAFVEDHYEGYVAPRLVVRLQHDGRGTPYLLLHGPEPDTHWEAFTARRPRGRRALRRAARRCRSARCRWRCRTRGRSW